MLSTLLLLSFITTLTDLTYNALFSIFNLALWVKNSANDILKYFSNFPQKTGFDISCNVSNGENVHELSNPVSLEKNEKNHHRRLLNKPREWKKLK